MENDQEQQAPQKTKETKTPFGAQIFSMPERYRHGAQAVLKEPEKKRKTARQVVTPPPPPNAPPKPSVPKPKKKKKSATKMILIIGGVVILLLGVGGYLMLRSVQKQEVDIVIEIKEETPVSRPAPEEQIKEEPEVKEEPELESDPFAIEVNPGKDSDSDGLSDTEEKLVYGTEPRLPDSDSDGFLDGNEVYHRYNPNGTAPGTLLETGLVDIYAGTAGLVLYEFYYPSVWDVEEGEEELVIDADTGEGFRISWEEKDESMSIEQWVLAYVGLEDFVEDTTKNGLEMIQSENTLIAYVDLGSTVFVWQYDTGIKTTVDYLQTFNMMLNSIEVVDEGEQGVAGVNKGEQGTEDSESNNEL